MAYRTLIYTAAEINKILKKAKDMPDEGIKGDKGDPGKSAYEVAVEEGFIGTEEEWLESLKGEQGKDGKNAENPNFSVTSKTLEYDQSATATLTGNYPDLSIEFGIPRGQKGSGGEGEGLTPEQIDNINKIPSIVGDVDGLKVAIGRITPEEVVNVLSIGIKANDNTAKESNATILKEYITENSMVSSGEKVKILYFPKGIYYFNPVEISDDRGRYRIILFGEELSPGEKENKVDIYTINDNDLGQSFITRTATDGTNSTEFIVKNMNFYSCINKQDDKPLGTCFGVTTDLDQTYNFHFENVHIFGYYYGFYTPKGVDGSSCKNVTLEHCFYGLYFTGKTTNLEIKDITLKNNMCGIRMSTGGKNCTISNVMVYPGYFNGMSDYEGRVTYSYGIHTKGGVTIDGVDWNVNGSPRIKDSYTVINYQGLGDANQEKKYYPVRISNMTLKQVYNYAKIFKGGCYIGGTPEAGGDYNEPEPESAYKYFPAGCVIFKNCFSQYGSCNNMIENYFDIMGGLDRAWGFYFEDREIISNGVAMSKTVKRRFNSYFNMNGHEWGSDIFSFNDIPEDKREYNGVRVYGERPKPFDNAVHFKGTITLNNLKNDDAQGGTLDMELVLIGVLKSGSPIPVTIKSFGNLKNYINKHATIVVDEYVGGKYMEEVFFGYESSSDGYLTNNGTKKVIYNMEVEQCNPEWINWEDNSKSYVCVE